MSDPRTISFADSAAALDALDVARRVLVCCVYGTSDRALLARYLADETPRALAGGIVGAKNGKTAVAELIDVHLRTYTDLIESEYRASSSKGDPHDPLEEKARQLAYWTQRFDGLKYDRPRVSARELAETALRVMQGYVREDDSEGHYLLEDLLAAYQPLEERLDDGLVVETFARLARDLILHAPRGNPQPITRIHRWDTGTDTSTEADHGARLAYWMARFSKFLKPYKTTLVKPRQLVDITLRARGRFDADSDPEGDDLWHELKHESAWLEDRLHTSDVHEDFANLARDLILSDPDKPWRAATAGIPPEAVERLVATLPRPALAPLREYTHRDQVAPGSLVVVPLDPDEAATLDPEDRFALALHRPDGLCFMFTYGHLVDPTAADLRDPDRSWPWSDEDPDAEIVVVARNLDWRAVAELLALDPNALPKDVRAPKGELS